MIIKLIGYNEIPCFKYLNQPFLCSFLQFYKFYPISFHFVGYFYSNHKMKIQFYPIDSILMGLNTQILPKLSVALLKILPPKNENNQIKNSDIFHISAQNIDCGYLSNHLDEAVLMSTHNL